MAELCTVADVEAVAGHPITPEETPRVERLIVFASAAVEAGCVPLPAPVPDLVSSVTAQLVVRQMANPAAVKSEGLGAWRASYNGPALALTDADRDQLGPWAKPEAGARAYSVWTPSPYGVDDDGGGGLFDHDDFPAPLQYPTTEGAAVSTPVAS